MEMWIVLVVVLVIGVGALAFFLGRLAESRSEKVKAMEQELAERKKELEEYRADVTRHFDRTGELFATLTGSYRDLYHHLAHGCEKLAEIPAKKLFPGAPAELEAGADLHDQAKARATEQREEQVGEKPERDAAAEPAAEGEPGTEPARDGETADTVAAQESPEQQPRDAEGEDRDERRQS
ncbi:YhcB family protein [Geoalkalibacter halelectricus]|uniref:Z-ring associated protein G n=1 Tax=Geoalkalibacter halelectricus TaxID=2847045 RepID=A0ABY5ZRX5_9BACT|nr:YhcB family protein [Geoalkalibacter halelectricus]MDO3378705.1 YhcB family protein [Geoalkalibacter halelectricus]UWZ79986.1 YhcB family protein [Geoalkalibacter halelectricus]